MKKIIFAILIVSAGVISVFAQDAAPSRFYQAMEWSPDGKYLTFTLMDIKSMKPMSMKADIYVMKADGSEMKKVTGDEKNEFFSSWSKDGKRVFFGASVQGSKESDIFAVNTDGSGLTQLTKNNQRNSAPSVSPDGNKIVFNSETVERKPQIYVMNADGSNIRALTNDTTLAFYNPIWSPDGKRIVYYTEKGDNKDQIWVMNADGSNQKLLTNNIGHNFYPSWSADGKRVIFTSERDGEKQVIYSLKTDGTDLKRVLKTNSFYAKISPDGKKIAYIAGQFPSNNIFIADADGANVIKLTN
jgi:TolB protein